MSDAPRFVAPTDSLIRLTIGAGAPSTRALNARLRRAEAAGLIPPRRYVSSQRYVYEREALLDALDRLPTSHSAALRERPEGG